MVFFIEMHFIGFHHGHAGNARLASCPWGPDTANGVDLLTEIYVIYQVRRSIRFSRREADTRKDGKLGNIYR